MFKLAEYHGLTIFILFMVTLPLDPLDWGSEEDDEFPSSLQDDPEGSREQASTLDFKAAPRIHL